MKNNELRDELDRLYRETDEVLRLFRRACQEAIDSGDQDLARDAKRALEDILGADVAHLRTEHDDKT